ncbi:histidine kinase, putative [Babesia ovis]|uniref:Histidine kinase, putative n=1 Tax=Babesia ovis TaxID=5869 RepID=A0A9W5TDA4_BABOV|nr:histidine kinase, putative [Babesia ovis]
MNFNAETLPPQTKEYLPETTMAISRPVVIREVFEGLDKEAQNLLGSASMALYHCCMMKYNQAIKSCAGKASLKPLKPLEFIGEFKEGEFKKALELLRKTETIGTQTIFNHLKLVRDQKYNKEVVAAKGKLVSKILERDRLRKLCLQKAKETLESYKSPFILSYLDSLEKENQLKEEAEDLYRRHERLICLLNALKTVHDRCSDKKILALKV